MKTNKNHRFAAPFFLVWCLSCAQPISDSAGKLPAFPEGWRAPLPWELARDKCGIRPNTPLEIGADFNGDGTQDSALIAVNESRNKAGLLVSMSSALWVVVEEREGTCATYGLEVYKPGTYTGYFCATDSKDCKPTKKEQIELILPGIAFFELGATGVTLFWNTKSAGFNRLWEGD